MKSIIAILLVSVAVANAAFSSSLVQRIQPLLQQATAETQLALNAGQYNRDFAALQSQIVTAIQQQATNIVGQIQLAIAAGQLQLQQAAAQILATLQQLQSLGGDLATQGQQILQNLLSNVLNKPEGFTRARQLIVNLDLTNLLSNAIQQVLQNFLTQAQIDALLAHISDIAHSGNYRGILDGLSNLSGILTTLIGIAQSSAGNTWMAVQTIVQSTLSAAAGAGQAALQSAVDKLIGFLKPFRWILGQVYDQVVAAANAMLGSPNVQLEF